MIPLTKNTFSIERQDAFVGYYDPARKWNGWDCPLFEWDESVKIVEWLNTWSGKEQLKVDHDRRVIVSLEDPDERFDIQGISIATEDGNLTLYAIGAGWWVWETSEKV